jgi:hypothetical protein
MVPCEGGNGGGGLGGRARAGWPGMAVPCGRAPGQASLEQGHASLRSRPRGGVAADPRRRQGPGLRISLRHSGSAKALGGVLRPPARRMRPVRAWALAGARRRSVLAEGGERPIPLALSGACRSEDALSLLALKEGAGEPSYRRVMSGLAKETPRSIADTLARLILSRPAQGRSRSGIAVAGGYRRVYS